jgi:hypothetical protein
MVAQQSNGAIPVVDPGRWGVRWDLADVTLRRAQHDGHLAISAAGEYAGALQADELGDVLEVLAKNVLVASREHRHGAHAEFEQLFFSRRIVHYVDRDEVNAFFRKKLFRPQATASTRLGEQGQFVSNALHDRVQYR